MTLFGFYRILEFQGMLNLSTITDPGKPIKTATFKEWKEFINTQFIPTLSKVILPEGYKVELSQPQPFPIQKSGPTTIEDRAMSRTPGNSSFFGLVSAAKLWVTHPLYEVLKRFLKE